MSNEINLTIDNASIRSIIQAKVQTAVADALMPHKEEFVRKLVEASLLAKSSDNAYRYKRDEEKPTVLEAMVRSIIAEEARKAIVAWAESHRDEIAENIHKQMATRKFGKAIAYQIAKQMAEANKYNFELTVTPVLVRE